MQEYTAMGYLTFFFVLSRFRVRQRMGFVWYCRISLHRIDEKTGTAMIKKEKLSEHV
jgi:hypothetical protein